jgi:hypothetical protein
MSRLGSTSSTGDKWEQYLRVYKRGQPPVVSDMLLDPVFDDEEVYLPPDVPEVHTGRGKDDPDDNVLDPRIRVDPENPPLECYFCKANWTRVYNPDRVKPHEELLYRVNIELKELGKVDPENSNPEMVSESIFDLANMVHDLCDQKYQYFMHGVRERLGKISTTRRQAVQLVPGR